jgi:hypothetical protein
MAESIENQLATLLGEYRVRAMRGSLKHAPILGYCTLAVVVSLHLPAQWTLAVFGPPLVLMAWLDALCRSHAIVGANLAKAGFPARSLGCSRPRHRTPRSSARWATRTWRGCSRRGGEHLRPKTRGMLR